jgi:hypothetical protein
VGRVRDQPQGEVLFARAGAKQLHVEVASWEQAAALVARILDAKA